MAKISGGELLVHCLLKEGVKYVFGIPGGQLCTFLDAIERTGKPNRLSSLKLTELPEPAVAKPDWAKIKTIYTGICGSDIGTILLKLSPALTPFSSFPTVLGHEAMGKIVEINSSQTESNLKVGDRVVIDPYITCRVRGIEPECAPCKEGYYSVCRNKAEGGLSPGMIIGSCRDEPGSWAEYFLVHISQLIKVPDNISDLTAVLLEPLSVGLHAVLKRPPSDNSKVLIIGGGMISYSIIIALRLLKINCHLTQSALFKYQVEMGKLFGINESCCREEGDSLAEKVSKLTGARKYKPLLGDYVYTGGFDYVYDCIGSPQSLKDAINLTREGGYLVMAGAAGNIPNIDLTFIWEKELNIIGTYGCGYELYNEEKLKTFELTLRLLQKNSPPVEKLITHKFSIGRYREAISANINRKGFGSIKTIFTFTP